MATMEAQNTDGVQPFTDDELIHLALRIIADRVAWVDDWLEWEDYPEMGQYEFERLTKAVEEQAKRVEGWSGVLDHGKGIDSLALLDRAQGE